ncbi:MAG: hypothetical protein GEU76_06020 [Alphaproteobacteria bacterium]|nr:hypothetical protein [Alphaproteobacteria bacterium]
MFPRTVTVALALALLALAPACSGAGLSFWPFRGSDTGKEPAPAAARPTTGLRAVAVRVRQEDEKAALRIAALANEALTRHGIRPEATAPNVLFLRFERPRTLQSRAGPKVGIVGRGGSSSETDLGLAIQIPLDGKPPPPQPARHEVFAELENGVGNVIWRGRAVKDAVPTAEIDNSVARDLIERVVARLARETDAKSGGSVQ